MRVFSLINVAGAFSVAGAFIAPPSRGVAARGRAGSHDLDTPSHGGRRL